MQQVADEKDDEGSLQCFTPESATVFFVVLMHYKCHSIPDGKKERWKHKISWCKPMPVCMKEGRIDRTPIAGIVNDNHETHGHAAKDVKSKVALIFCHKGSFANKASEKIGNRVAQNA